MEVNRTKPSPSVSSPWSNVAIHFFLFCARSPCQLALEKDLIYPTLPKGNMT
jgi:hypothetical protein